MQVRRIALGVASLAAALLSACALSGPQQFESDEAYKRWVASLELYGVTGQAAMARAQREDFTCGAASGVIRDAPAEIVITCQRKAATFSCAQEQAIVLRLDWIGTPKPALALGMRVRDVAGAAGPIACK